LIGLISTKNIGVFWVALEDDEKTVIASGRTAKEVWVRAQEKGFTKPILTRMPEKLVTYVGFGL